MSYNCSVEFYGIDDLDKDILKDLEKMMESSYLSFDTNGYFMEDRTADCEDDPTGVIFDWAKKHGLTFTVDFSGEEGLGDTIKYIDGERQDA